MRHVLTILAMLALIACSREPPVPRRAPRREVVRGSVTPPPAAAMQTLEDPPYDPDSVFRPETHRGGAVVLPKDALLVSEVITGKDTGAFSFFGEAVAVDGARAVVGAPYADIEWKTDAGAAYVFRREGTSWRQEAKLSAPRPQIYERFGVSVAIDGDVVVVGADRSDQHDHTDAGAAFVYERRGNAWHHRATLTHGDERAAAGFSVAVQSKTAAVGAPGANAVLVFERRDGTWREAARLAGPSGLGHAVAIDDETLVAGAITGGEPLLLAGAAYVFRRDGDRWQEEAQLLSPRAEELARFGAAVAIRGDRALVSAPRATVTGRARAGAAWLFERAADGWRAVQEVTSEPPRSDEEFGRALSLSDRGAVIGSQFSDAAGLNTGGAVVFALEDGRLTRHGALLAQDLKFMNEFAFALATTEDAIVVGAPRRGENDNATGFVYIYRPDW